MPEKTYINGIIIKSKQWDDGGETLKLSIKADEFTAQLQEHADANGWVNVDICRRKQPSDKGQTHYMVLGYKKTEGHGIP